MILWDVVKVHEELLFGLRRNSREYLGAKMLRKDNGSLADASSSTMDQDCLSRLHSSCVKDCVVCCAIDDRERCCSCKVHAMRNQVAHRFRSADEVAEHSKSPGQHSVAWLEFARSLSNAGHNATAVKSKCGLL